MANDKNVFGGGNRHSLYTPMSEDEREVLARLVEDDALEVHILGWGKVNKFSEPVRFGDARIRLPFKVVFSSPAVAIPVTYFDLELRTRYGDILFRERQSTLYQNKPLYVSAGTEIHMAWHIQIRQMDPKLVKAIKPGARGLTTREGNRKLNANERDILQKLRASEHANRQDLQNQVRKAEKLSVLEDTEKYHG